MQINLNKFQKYDIIQIGGVEYGTDTNNRKKI